MFGFVVAGVGWAIGLTLVGMTIEYFGQIGFLLILVLAALVYAAGSKLPIQRWRWRFDRWVNRR